MKKPIICWIILICIVFSGCAAPVTARDTTVFAMDTAMNLRIYGDDGSAAAELADLLTDLDAGLSVTDANSALYALNETGSSSDETVLTLLEAAAALCERTGGAVDPSVYPAVRLWGFTTDAFRVPSDGEIAAALEHIGLPHVHAQDGLVTLDPDTALDFGAFAKGWAGERCRALLEQRGLSAILTLGGNIQTVGSKPDSSDWVVGVADPDAPSDSILTLRLRGSKAVVTSGDYQRFFEDSGVRYCHIFDPATGRPVQNSLRSVTVICDSGLTADGLSTALFVMGYEKAVEFWRQSDDFEAVFIADDGTISVTEGLQNLVSAVDYILIRR